MKKQIFYISLFVVLVVLAVLWRELYFPMNPGAKGLVKFRIEKGQNTEEIANNLMWSGLIRRSAAFNALAFLTGASKKMQAGEYELSPAMSLAKVLKKIAEGDIIKKKIKIIEGWTLSEVGEYLEQEEISSKKDFLTLAKSDFSKEFDFLRDKPKGLDLEGYIFPDTYEVSEKAAARDVIEKALNNLESKLTSELRQEISRQKRSIFEIITMASLIEKEVKTIEDKKVVSGILWKRIKVGMLLQVDATITYITGKNSIQVSIDETKIDSPYNTYKYAGLPIGPISSPGLDSILAAIYPEDSDYWYYLSTPDGRTIFSKTYKEHTSSQDNYLNNNFE